MAESASEAFWGDFQDGSNDWWSGTVETLENPVDRVMDPYGTVAGAADAGALNFDEGVGGLATVFDDEEGNTAGPGETEMWTPTPDDIERTANDAADAADAVTPAWLRWMLNNQEIVAGGLLLLLLLYLTKPFAEAGAAVAGDS